MKKFNNILNSIGIKITPQRLLVLKKLSSIPHPISARELHKKIKTINLASVYRSLNLFEKSKIINIEIVKQEKLYCLSEYPHHHIICKKCGYTEEIDCNHHFQNFKNFSNIQHQLTLTGTCKKCLSKKI